MRILGEILRDKQDSPHLSTWALTLKRSNPHSPQTTSDVATHHELGALHERQVFVLPSYLEIERETRVSLTEYRTLQGVLAAERL